MNVFRFKSSNNSTTNAAVSKEAEAAPSTHEPLLTAPADYTPPAIPAVDEQQQQKIEKLKEYIKTIMLPEDHEYYESEKRFLTEGTYKRYFRARKWDYEVWQGIDFIVFSIYVI